MLGVIACAVAVAVIALSALSMLVQNQALQMVTAILAMPLGIVIAGVVGLVGIIFAIVAGVRVRGRIVQGSIPNGDAAKSRWKLGLLLSLIGTLALPALLAVMFLAFGS